MCKICALSISDVDHHGRAARSAARRRTPQPKQAGAGVTAASSHIAHGVCATRHVACASIEYLRHASPADHAHRDSGLLLSHASGGARTHSSSDTDRAKAQSLRSLPRPCDSGQRRQRECAATSRWRSRIASIGLVTFRTIGEGTLQRPGSVCEEPTNICVMMFSPLIVVAYATH
jgi:hypothetical protein